MAAWNLRLTTGREWLRFPLGRIVGSQTLEDAVARLVWITIPLEFYVLTRFSGGVSVNDHIAVTVIALAAILLVLLVSVAVALVARARDTSFEQRVRVWSVSLILTWAAALALLALGYGVGQLFGGSQDVVAAILFPRLDRALLGYGRYPHLLDPTTFLIYLCYAAGGLVFLNVVARLFGGEPEGTRAAGPSALSVAALSAFVMMVLHGASVLV